MSGFEEPVRDPEGVEVGYLERAAGLDGRNVLEIGCGNGRLLRRYAGLVAAATGLDPDAGRLAEALGVRSEFEGMGIDFVQGNAERLPFSDGAFEGVVFGWSLWWVEHEGMVHALLESRRVLGVGGVLVDIRPYTSRPDLEVITAGEIFVPGKLDDEGGAVDDVAADVAMAEVVRRGLFALEGQDSFLFSLYWNSLEGMLAYAAEKWSFVEIATAVVERAREYAAGVEGAYRVRVRNVVQLRRYRKV